MGAALDITKQAYEDFGRRDIPAFLKLVADEVDWKVCCPTSWPISGLRRNPAEVGDFFAAFASFDEMTVFEPREFIEAGDHVTVLGYQEGVALDTKQTFKTEWAQLWTVRNGKITRWRAFGDTAARYGH
jgi:ketosteroid isomerase-like protein